MIWEDFFGFVLPHVPACPEATATHNIREAARSFATRTRLWQEEAPAIPSVAGVGAYTLQLLPETELVRINACEVSGVPYDVAGGIAARHARRHGQQQLCVMLGPQDFLLAPTPALTGIEIVTDITLRPSKDATAWPDDFAEHAQAIADGALSMLLLLPDLLDGDRAAAHMLRFDEAVERNTQRLFRGYGRQRASARVEWF